MSRVQKTGENYVKPTNNTNTPKTDRCRKLGGQGYSKLYNITNNVTNSLIIKNNC